jgi:hypothetical protein
VGGDNRTLYTFTGKMTGAVEVHPGGGPNKKLLMGWGPDATVRLATKQEAEAHWQSPLHAGWKVAGSSHATKMEFPRWKVDVSVGGEVLNTYYETATTKEAAIAKVKRKYRGAVSNVGAFKFTAHRDDGSNAHATKHRGSPSVFSQLRPHDHFNTHPGSTPARYMKVDATTSVTLSGPYKGQHVEQDPHAPVWPSKTAHATKYSSSASDKIGKTMHEFKHGQLKSGSGHKVTSRKQAIAIGISQARRHGYKVPAGPPAHARKKQLDRDIAESLHKKHGPGCGCAHATEAAGWKHDRDDAKLFGRSGAQQGHTKAVTLKFASEYGFSSTSLRDAVAEGWEAEKRDRTFGWES